MTKRTRRTKAEIEASKGLGDTVEKVFKATGIDKVAKFILGEDCGCNERKAKLNALFPYRNAKCLTEEEYSWIKNDISQAQHTITASMKMQDIYNRVTNNPNQYTSCESCLRDMYNSLIKMLKIYEEDNIK